MSDYEPVFDEFTSGADDVLEVPDLDGDDTDSDYEIDDDENDSWECAYPGRCLMAFTDHLRSECHTVEDAIACQREIEQEASQ